MCTEDETKPSERGEGVEEKLGSIIAEGSGRALLSKDDGI